jgi:hypothetical protein
MITLADLCAEVNNYFVVSKVFGVVSIEDNGKNIYLDETTTTVPTDKNTVIYDLAQDGQYFRIVGSLFNDGVYQAPDYNLHDEIFEGAVWLMAVPSNFVELLNEINTWLEKNSEVLNSPYQSESFGGYSYSRSSDTSLNTWQGAFASRLRKWRKIRV